MTRSASRSAAPEGPPRGAPDLQRPGAQPRPSAGHYRRRRLAALLVVALVVLVGLGVGARALVYDAGLADVEDVRVTGALTVATPDVLAAAAVPVGTPLADVDTATIADRVARLPALASVRVTRGWPHTVTVAVTERVPVAATPAGDLVDGDGVIYPGSPAVELPRLALGAAGPDDPATRDALAALTALPAQVRGLIRTVDVSVSGPGAPAQVSFGLDQDRRVRWGTPERAADKATALSAILTQPGQVYDVTSPDLPTVRR